MPSERWSWDPVSRRYRDGNSGRFLSHEKIARIRNDYAATHRQWADDLASNLASRDLTVARWELEMRGRLKSVYLSQYMLGRGGKNAMTQADYGRVGRMLVDQYGYLRTFATDLTTGTLSVAQIGARMQLYFESAVQAFERGKAVAYDADLILPAYPADGRTDCRARCVGGQSVVAAIGVSKIYRRRYVGEMVEIETTIGHKLAVTPNHPILTDRGWQPAGDLSVGDHVIRRTDLDRLTGSQPDIERRPSAANELYDALADLRDGQRIGGRPVDFHGDGSGGEIDVVDVDGLLRDYQQAAFVQPLEQITLELADLLAAAHLFTDGDLAHLFDWYRSAARRIVRSAGEVSPLVFGETGHSDDCRLAPATWLDSASTETVDDDLSRAAQRARKSLHALTGEKPCADFIVANVATWFRSSSVQLETGTDQMGTDGMTVHAIEATERADALAGSCVSDQIIRVDRYFSTDHVYNLETASGWYIANGIIVHNCKCRWRITETKTEFRCYWTLGKAEHCAGCLDRRARYSPFIWSKSTS